METVFKYRFKELGEHMHVSLFAGVDFDHLALCGKLIFRLQEWNDFKGSLKDASKVVFERSDNV